jgi:hypothetical protein
MKRLILAAAAFAVLAPPVLAAARPTHVDSPKLTVVVAQDLVVGMTILKPGEYKFQCRMFDGTTFLVVTAVDTGKEITRVPCTQEMRENKITESEYRTLVRPDGKHSLTLVRIKGEAVAHRLVLNQPRRAAVGLLPPTAARRFCVAFAGASAGKCAYCLATASPSRRYV